MSTVALRMFGLVVAFVMMSSVAGNIAHKGNPMEAIKAFSELKTNAEREKYIIETIGISKESLNLVKDHVSMVNDCIKKNKYPIHFTKDEVLGMSSEDIMEKLACYGGCLAIKFPLFPEKDIDALLPFAKLAIDKAEVILDKLHDCQESEKDTPELYETCKVGPNIFNCTVQTVAKSVIAGVYSGQ